jgi:phenylacetate-CoA ligase
MVVFDKVYGMLPIFLQNLAISAFGFTWNKRRFGGVFNDELIKFKSRENFASDDWLQFQNESIRGILIHAYKNVPFYTMKFTQLGFNEDSLAKFALDDLQKLPFLEKDMLRQHGTTTLISTNPEPNGEFFASSGSTGTPTQIVISHTMHQRWSAGFEARIRNWAGIDRSTPRGTIGGRRVVRDGLSKGPFYRYNLVEKQVYFSAYHISLANVQNYVEGMFKHKIEYMTGYAMSNFLLARFIEGKGIKAPQLKAVITSSEKLTQEMRDTFKRVYGCKTFDSYSGVEACGLISECEEGSLHVSPDMGIIEFLNKDQKPAEPGELAELVCTGILNFNQPLIRYRIGDMAVLGESKCACGRNMPVVSEITGRVEDVVIGPDGREMVRFHGIFINISNIIRAQVIQEEIDHFIINVEVSSPLSTEQNEIILTRMKSQLGSIKVKVNQVDEIPLNANGKFKAVISKVKRNKI